MKHDCMAEIANNGTGCYIAQDDFTPNELFYLCSRPAVDAVDFFGKTIYLCAEHFDVFAPTYPAAF
jgi:hypothetical protein